MSLFVDIDDHVVQACTLENAYFLTHGVRKSIDEIDYRWEFYGILFELTDINEDTWKYYANNNDTVSAVKVYRELHPDAGLSEAYKVVREYKSNKLFNGVAV